MFTEQQKAELEALAKKVEESTRDKPIGEDHPLHTIHALLRILTGKAL